MKLYKMIENKLKLILLLCFAFSTTTLFYIDSTPIESQITQNNTTPIGTEIKTKEEGKEEVSIKTSKPKEEVKEKTNANSISQPIKKTNEIKKEPTKVQETKQETSDNKKQDASIKTIKLKNVINYKIPNSIPQNDLNENEYDILCEVLYLLNNSTENEVELNTLFKGGIDDAKKVIDIIENTCGVPVQTCSLVRCNEERICTASIGDYTKITINPSKTNQIVKDRKYVQQSTLNALNKAGVKSGMDEEESFRKIGKWVCNFMSYKAQNNPLYDVYKSHKGDCASYAELTAMMCSMCGIKNKIVASDTHVWNYVRLNGKWYYSDLTWADDGYNNINNKYFLSKTLWKDKDHSLNETYTIDYKTAI